jgi:hypothetical protein
MDAWRKIRVSQFDSKMSGYAFIRVTSEAGRIHNLDSIDPACPSGSTPQPQILSRRLASLDGPEEIQELLY